MQTDVSLKKMHRDREAKEKTLHTTLVKETKTKPEELRVHTQVGGRGGAGKSHRAER